MAFEISPVIERQPLAVDRESAFLIKDSNARPDEFGF
jgi:hypothetical protein